MFVGVRRVLVVVAMVMRVGDHRAIRERVGVGRGIIRRLTVDLVGTGFGASAFLAHK
jgi:hypothetical protein